MRSVLNYQKIKENSQYLLKLLNLPKNFYELSKVSENKYFMKVNDIGEILLDRFSVFRVLYDFFKKTRPIYSISEIPEKTIKRDIEIELADESKHIVYITKYSKAFDVCYELAQKIGVISWLDYKLILEKKNVEERVLDDDEYVFKALNIQDILMENPFEEPSLYEKFKELIRGKYRLKWKKNIFLSSKIESVDYSKDPIKSNLMTCQVFNEILQKKFELSVNDYCVFAALYSFIYHGSLMKIENKNWIKFIEKSIVPNVIPIEVFLKENRIVWMNIILIFWRKFSLEITKIIDFNRFLNNFMNLK